MANDSDMSGWSDLLHSSSKLLDQATPPAQFPPPQIPIEQMKREKIVISVANSHFSICFSVVYYGTSNVEVWFVSGSKIRGIWINCIPFRRRARRITLRTEAPS
ncbi:unnamed protein product [Fraxinus pennsylvanica]|uniref:Uncharacterized protein n=1 Tax=Fraxinus pennsylvanica TaxID=56036 RepID=A0AAD2E9A3_9LAMI|nr:unnamed protein product [Fraxinus pennsylvanica]